jgi:hypothetical protein
MIKKRFIVAGATFMEYLHKAISTYGSIRSAAEALDIPYSTLRGWVRNNPVDVNNITKRFYSHVSDISERISKIEKDISELKSVFWDLEHMLGVSGDIKSLDIKDFITTISGTIKYINKQKGIAKVKCNDTVYEFDLSIYNGASDDLPLPGDNVTVTISVSKVLRVDGEFKI